jgi:hypothetical protein
MCFHAKQTAVLKHVKINHQVSKQLFYRCVLGLTYKTGYIIKREIKSTQSYSYVKLSNQMRNNTMRSVFGGPATIKDL